MTAANPLTMRVHEFRFAALSGDSNFTLRSDLRRQIYLIFKEAVNNSIRHSGCTQMDLQLSVEGKELQLTISDNGCGLQGSLIRPLGKKYLPVQVVTPFVVFAGIYVTSKAHVGEARTDMHSRDRVFRRASMQSRPASFSFFSSPVVVCLFSFGASAAKADSVELSDGKSVNGGTVFSINNAGFLNIDNGVAWGFGSTVVRLLKAPSPGVVAGAPCA